MSNIFSKIFKVTPLFFLIIVNVCAFEKIEHTDGLGDPSSYVAGCVNVTNGAFVYSSPDLVIDCPEEISFVRHYNSFNTLEDTFGTGFTNNYVFGDVRFSYDNKTKVKTVYVDEKGGNCLKYSKTISGLGLDEFPLDHSFIDSGLTNTYTGSISGKTNLRNSYVVATDKPSKLKLMKFGDGTTREFNKNNRLIKEKRPSGNIILYNYVSQKENKLKSVTAYSADYSKILGWLNFSYDAKNGRCTVKSSDQKYAVYRTEENRVCKVPRRYQKFLQSSKTYNQNVNSYTYLNETKKIYPEDSDTYIKIDIKRLGSINVLGKSRLKCVYDNEGRVGTIYVPGSKGLDAWYKFIYNANGTDVTKVYNSIGGIEEFLHSNGRVLSKTTYEKVSSKKTQPYKTDFYPHPL